MTGQLENRVATITGGTRGIGFAIAKAFLAEGARVAIVGRNADKGERALKELDAGDRALLIVGDVMVKADCERAVDDTVARFGNIDILVNNAGGSLQHAPIMDMTDEAWFHAMDWNLNSTFFCTRRALRHMAAQQWGRVINISSLEGKIGKACVSGYAAAKHGLHGFTKSLANEVGTIGITANCICPGLVLTDTIEETTPIVAKAMGLSSGEDVKAIFLNESATKQPAKVEEMAAMAVLLASEYGASLTGQSISIDGGSAPY